MKKIFFAICLVISVRSFSQLDGISVNLSLRAGDWAFLVGTIDNTMDSTSIVFVNRLRDTMQLANPANFNTVVRFNSIPASIVFKIYRRVKELQETIYAQVGNNIDTQIKAIVSVPLQTAITAYDNIASTFYLDARRRGKNFLSDN